MLCIEFLSTYCLAKEPFSYDIYIVWCLCKNYTKMSVKLSFIPASALVGMHSTYIGQLMQSAAAPLILRMHTCIGSVAYT